MRVVADTNLRLLEPNGSHAYVRDGDRHGCDRHSRRYRRICDRARVWAIELDSVNAH